MFEKHKHRYAHGGLFLKFRRLLALLVFVKRSLLEPPLHRVLDKRGARLRDEQPACVETGKNNLARLGELVVEPCNVRNRGRLPQEGRAGMWGGAWHSRKRNGARAKAREGQ